MRLHRRWRWLLIGLPVLGMAVAITLWMMFQRVPAWYRPMAIAPGDQRVKDDLSFASQRFSDMLVAMDRPFEYRLTQDQVNAWLAVREDIWPLSREWLPPELSDPFLRFDEQGVTLAVTWTGDGFSSVISARLSLQPAPGGISVRLVGVDAGALPVPEEWVRDALVKADRSGWPAGEKLKHQRSDTPLPRLANLPEGAVFPNAWVWWNGSVPFLVRDVRFEPGAVVATFERLPAQPDTR